MSETDRIREAYARRRARGADDRYSVQDPANRYLFERRERALLALLHRHGLMPLRGRRILDVGCGNGAVLGDLVRLGATAGLLAGVDLLPERIAAARARGGEMSVGVADATALPFKDATFDVAVQFTLLSSVLDDAYRGRIAAQTMRVLRPGGVLIWYDFIWNPLNRDVRGVDSRALARLYSGCAIDARRVTLAPPITRLASRLSPRLCGALETLPALRSHLMAAITKPAEAR
jgi:ubiquinone/menaquinone biosynthesis C-methylase UbiE